MKKEKKTSKKVFKKRLASILTCAIVGLGSAGLLTGCTVGNPEDLVWRKGDTLPISGVVGEFFYDTDDNMLYQYTETGWVEISEIKGEDGEDGRSVEIQKVGNVYQWKYTDESTWHNLVDVDALKGAAGKNVELRVNNTDKTIEWCVAGSNDWDTLISLAAITGENGKNVELRTHNGYIQWTVAGTDNWQNLYAIPSDGREVEIDVIDGVISWKYTSEADTEWKEITAVSELVGETGKNIKLQQSGEWIQWAVEGSNDWTNLYKVPTNGVDGREVEIDVIDGVISWKYTNEDADAWREITAVSELVGETGAAGKDGKDGATISSVEFVEDKWGIESKIVLTLNDANNTKVESNVVVRVYENLYYTAESAEDVLKLMEYGVENIKLGADVTFAEKLYPTHDVSFDLDGHKFTYPLNGDNRMYIENGVTVEFKDGDMEFGVEADKKWAQGSIVINTQSTIVLDNVNYLSHGTALFPRGDTALVKVVDSVVIGQTYAIATNASLDPVTKLPIHAGIEVIVDNSEIKAMSQDKDNAGLLFNVPGTLTVTDSEIVGDRQAAIVRGGDAKIADTKLVCTGDFEGVFKGWANGNEVPSAALVVGNEGNGYKWTTSLVLDGVKTIAKRARILELYVASNAEEEFATSLTLVNHNFTKTQLARTVFAEYANLTIVLDNIKPAFDIVDAYGAGAVQSGVVNFVLGSDVVVDEDYLTMDQLMTVSYLYETLDFSEYEFLVENINLYVQTQEEFDQAMKVASFMGGEINIKLGCDVYYYLTDPAKEMIFELVNIVKNGYNFELIESVAVEDPMEFAAAITETENTKDAVVLQRDINFAQLLDGVQTYGARATDDYSTIEISRDLIIDLQGYTLKTVAEYAGRINIVNGATVTIKNGNLNLAATKANDASIGVYAGSTLNVENVDVSAPYTAFIVYGDATALRITENSYVSAGTYAIGTNSGAEENYGVEITVKDSVLDTANYDDGNDNTAMFVVVPSQVLIMNSRLIGDRQALIVRGGKTMLMNSELVATGAFENKDAYTTSEWKNGNEVPTAALVVGDRQAGYKEFDTFVYAMNTIISTPEGVKDIYAYNDAMDIGVKVGVMFDYYDGDSSKVVLGEAVRAKLGEVRAITTLNGFQCFDLQEAIDNTVPQGGMEDEGIQLILYPGNFQLPTAVTINKKVSIYLSNTNISIPEDTAGDGVFHVVKGGDLTIYGQGVIDGCGDNKYNIAVFVEGGKLTINGGTYTNENLLVKDYDTDADHFDLIYVKGGEAIINDGVFKGFTPDWLLNIRDDRRQDSSIVVNGGFFYGFNPADNATEGEGTNYVANGVEVVERELGLWAVGASVNAAIPGQGNEYYPEGGMEE